MRDTDPESSFQNPEDYKEFKEEATEAMERYQRIRRPLMFHLLLLILFFPKLGTYEGSRWVESENPWETGQSHVEEKYEYDPPLSDRIFDGMGSRLPFLILSIPVLGLVSGFRRLDDGFQNDDPDKPTFTLSTHWDFSGASFREEALSFVAHLKWTWFWETWAFYLKLVIMPIFGLIMILPRGFRLFRDLFFLRCWDKWYYAIENDSKPTLKERFIRGSRIQQLPATSGGFPDALEEPKEPGRFKNAWNALRGRDGDDFETNKKESENKEI